MRQYQRKKLKNFTLNSLMLLMRLKVKTQNMIKKS